MDCSPHVFLVPQPLLPHGGDLERKLGNELIQGLLLPEGIISRVLMNLAPEGELIVPFKTGVVSGRSNTLKSTVVVITLPGNGFAFSFYCRLKGEVIEVGLTKRTIVEPVVPHPAVDHRALRRGYLKRG